MMRWETLGLLALGALGGSAALPVTLAYPPPLPPVPRVENPDVVFEGVTLCRFHGSTRVATGTASVTRYSRSAGLVDARGVRTHILPSQPSQKEAWIETGSAVAFASGKAIDGWDGVTLIRDDGRVVTASAHYDAASHLVFGLEPVTITDARSGGPARSPSPETEIQGSAFTLDTQTEQVEVYGPVNARHASKANSP